MDVEARLDEALAALGALSVTIRYERMGGEGGGLCRLKTSTIVFVDLDADLPTRLSRCVDALATIDRTDVLYLSPALREMIDDAQTGD